MLWMGMVGARHPRGSGYCSNIARHRLVGDESDLDPKLQRMYDTTQLMSVEVRKAVKAGALPTDLNTLAHQVADGKGYGQ